ncbi:hypothetical protein EIP91_006600 [Steccherinum ochraceum]|uniref:Uncharacterized protein n=1 Tax=Steccherinum ochraceum TaxID=92696 RepID=A0A4V2MVN5_9APHY|nr:hypothetical protein EIP91_006600 [Steccherinum ochraceum]
MQFKLFILAAFAAVAVATPTQLEKRVSCREVFFPDTCAAGEILCDGAGAIQICCTGGCQ